MKKLLAMIIAAVIVMAGMSAFAADITVNVNGEAIEFDQQPVMEGETLLIPFRFVAQKLGANVSWYEDNEGTFPIQQVLAQYKDIVTVMQIGNHNIFVDGNVVALEVAPKIEGSRTLVTIPAIENALGATATWNAETSTLDIVTAAEEVTEEVSEDAAEEVAIEEPVADEK